MVTFMINFSISEPKSFIFLSIMVEFEPCLNEALLCSPIYEVFAVDHGCENSFCPRLCPSLVCFECEITEYVLLMLHLALKMFFGIHHQYDAYLSEYSSNTARFVLFQALKPMKHIRTASDLVITQCSS